MSSGRNTNKSTNIGCSLSLIIFVSYFSIISAWELESTAVGFITILIICIVISSLFIRKDVKQENTEIRERIEREKKIEENGKKAEESRRVLIASKIKKSESIIKEYATKHKTELASEREKLIKKGSFNEIILDDWKAKVDYFYYKVLIPEFSFPIDFSKNMADYHLSMYNHDFYPDPTINHYSIIDEIALKEQKKIQKMYSYDPAMSGVDYEKLCGNMLKNKQWDIQYTQGSGDQGVDIIAKKASVIIAIQCKRHKKPVGNKAVQEVSAGKIFYRTTHAIVIASNGFTPSAIELANKTNVLLLNHNTLLNIEDYI